MTGGTPAPRITWVTMLYDLRRREQSLRKSVDEIVADGRKLTFGIRRPLVVYTDPELTERVLEERDRLGLSSLTRVVPIALEDTRTYHALGERLLSLDESLFERGPRARLTPLCHVLMNAKLDFIAACAGEQPFGSTHIGWIDLGLAYAAAGTAENVEDMDAHAPDELRLCRMYPIAPEQVHRGFKWHVFAGGLMTASTAVWRRVVTEFRVHAERSLAAGIPRLDEPLLASVWAEQPDLFSLYDGDYVHILMNAVRPTVGGEHILGMAMRAAAGGSWQRSLEIGRRLLQARLDGGLELDPHRTIDLLHLVYAASEHADREHARSAAKQLIETIEANPELAEAFPPHRKRVLGDLALLRREPRADRAIIVRAGGAGAAARLAATWAAEHGVDVFADRAPEAFGPRYAVPANPRVRPLHEIDTDDYEVVVTPEPEGGGATSPLARVLEARPLPRKRAKPRLLVLVLSANADPFAMLEQAALRTWAAQPPAAAEVLFYSGGTELVDDPPRLVLPVPDDTAGIGRKTLACFEHVLATRSFDVVFRTHSSSYVDVGGALRFAGSQPSTGFYGGRPGWTGYERFVSGAGYFLSRDLVAAVVERSAEWNHEALNDVALARILFRHGVEPVSVLRQDVGLDDPPESIDRSLFHFRCRQLDRMDDVTVMERVHTALAAEPSS